MTMCTTGNESEHKSFGKVDYSLLPDVQLETKKVDEI